MNLCPSVEAMLKVSPGVILAIRSLSSSYFFKISASVLKTFPRILEYINILV